jgi:hypothetical protein
MVCAAAHAGILITRSAQGLQFADAAQVLINGKDKVLTLGAEPKLTTPLNKLKDTKLGGSLIQDVNSGVFVLTSDSEAVYILPENLGKTAATDPAAIWKSAAKIAIKKTANDKAPVDVAAGSFVAFLAGGPEELTRLCMDEQSLALVGGKDKTFATQLEWIAAVAKQYGSNAAMAPLERYVESAMRSRYLRFETGTSGLEVLQQALQFAELSQSIYPNQAAQIQLRKNLTERKAWLDRKIAVLRAFDAAGEWDAFLLGARDFERYQRAYPEMTKRHTDALKASLSQHRDAGERRRQDGEFGAAWREFRLASLRQPSDKAIQQRVLASWTDYSRQLAVDQQRNRNKISDGDRAVISQDLTFAENYLKQGKIDLALKNTLDAERIDPKSLQVLLKKAEILGAQRDYSKALATLDDYDRLAVNEERKLAADLRNDLLFKRTTLLDETKSQIQKAWNEQRFHRIQALAKDGLRGKDDDADLLYQSGLASLAIRDVKQGREMLARYLDVTNTLDADEAQRARVRTVLATITEATGKDQGDANWMSGKKLGKGIYYDPTSLAFQPRVDRVDASNKLKVAFEWEGDRLRAIVPTFEKNERVTGEKKISFVYEDRIPQVAVVNGGDAPVAPLGADPDERFKQSNLVLLNNPYVDPVAIEKLTGKNVTLGVAGNRFFNPFVWERPYYFALAYDEEGRVAQARELTDPKAGTVGVLLEFEWDGMQLSAIRGYQGADRRAVKIYERSLQYQDDRLVGEDIQGSGRNSKIKYNYNAGRLVSAECTTDQTLDGRSRKVAFK